MSQVAWRPSWVRGAKVDEIAWIGKDVLAWCAGVSIVFFHVAQKRETLRWCPNTATGEGAHRISSHVSLPIFAFCEKVANPRIMVFAYPSMRKVSECARGSTGNFLATAFTARDHLVSVGSYPDFIMTVWSWKTGEKIVTVNTAIRDDVGQTLRVTQTGSVVVAQIGRTCGRLFTWDVDIVGKVSILKDHEVTLPNDAPIFGADWSSSPGDALLAITDEHGHIYLSNSNGTVLRRIVLSQRCGVCLEIERPMIRWFRDGIVLRTTFCQIRYYKEDPKSNEWRKQWHVKSETKPCALATHPFRSDRLFYHTQEGHLMQLDFPHDKSPPVVRRLLCSGTTYKFVDLVYPWGHHVVATDDLKELVVLERYSGQEVSRVYPDVNGGISRQRSHPAYPLIAVTGLQGELVLIGVIDPDQPEIVARIHLHRHPLDMIKFSQSGRSLIVGEKRTGTCYCVNLFGNPKPFTVTAQLLAKRRICDCLLYEVRGRLKALLLVVGVKQLRVGHQVLVFDAKDEPGVIEEATTIFDLPAVYRKLYYTPGDPQLLVGSPYLTRQLHLLKLADWKDATVVDGVLTGHHVRRPRVYLDRQWIVTCAFDGLVIARDRTLRGVVAVVMPHHRHDLGTSKAVIGPAADFVAALGYDGSLVAMRALTDDNEAQPGDVETAGKEPRFVYEVDHGEYERRKRKILADYAALDPQISEALSRFAAGFATPDGGEAETWVEWMNSRRIERETRECAERRAEILRDFASLKAALVKLLNENEASAELARLPVSSFDLDNAGRDQRLKVARDEREDVRLELESNCSSMDRVAQWLKTSYWDPLASLGQSIFSIFGSGEVTNYPSMPAEPHEQALLRSAQFYKESVRAIVGSETFVPWVDYAEARLRFELSKPVRLYHEDERHRMDALLEEEEREIDPEELEEQRAAEGMTTYRFVEQSPHFYSQMESYGVGQVAVDNRYLMHDCKKLRTYFNKLFDDMLALKEREMSALRERNDRIRYIDNELRIMFDQTVPRIPADVEWHWKEKPEGVIKVLDREVNAKPYVSPSQQDILDRQAAEAERIRQLLLADDFRERALIAMMNGVLEVRWEDTIKLDIPKPQCMIVKKPEQYTAEDIVVVKQYEKDVQFLAEERERYKRILETDFVKMSALVEESIDKFNAKMDELFLVKMKVEAASNQLNLRYARGCARVFHRVNSLKEDARVKQRIAANLSCASVLTSQLHTLQNVCQELVQQHEALCSREKPLSKKFKSEFSALDRASVEALERQYKRRPRATLRNANASDLLDLARHAVSQTKPLNLPLECSDYLRQLDFLDARPSGLSPNIEKAHWEHFARLRRQRIELELRIRAQQAEIGDAQATISAFNDKLNKCRAREDSLREELARVRRERALLEQNAEVQLVLKMGQVECPLHGRRDDAAGAIFVPRAEVERVNELVLAAGSGKLNAMSRTIEFHRGTLYKEWVHGCLRRRLDDLREDLDCVRKVVVTRDMQDALKRRARGFRDDWTAQRLERELRTMRECFAKSLREHVARLEGVRERIRATRASNDRLDRLIARMNVVRCEMVHGRDTIGEARRREHAERKMRVLVRRADLIGRLQDNYAELLALHTEHELLRMRRYPALQFFRTLHGDPDKRGAC